MDYLIGKLRGLKRKFIYLKSYFFYKKLFKKCGSSLCLMKPKSIVGYKCIFIGDNFFSFSGLQLEAFPSLDLSCDTKVTIGNNVSINYDCHIACINNIFIGNNVLIASRVYISDHSHGLSDYSDIDIPPSQRIIHSKGPVIIEDNVWLGEGVVVLPGVTIGKGTIVGANSVVTRNLPPYTVCAGVPAKVLKKIENIHNEI
ncbi:acyltransferase [Shewanella vesiculosa]|uniref:acyltransferase n=1 Tax=Shewanella vesiculosa TaxID=518738 RepID=UPI003D04CD22